MRLRASTRRFLPPVPALRNFRFGMEPARRFAPRTWVPQLHAASGRSRARMSITRLFTSSRRAVLLRVRR